MPVADEVLPEQGSTISQLIILQTDLQDSMHVAKPVTSTEEVVSFCNVICPKSASHIPRLRIDFEKLGMDLPVVGVMGEMELIRDFLQAVEIPTQSLLCLKSFGLYAVHHEQRIYVILWPGPAGWSDKTQRRSLISFVHYVLQLTKDVRWLVGQKDLDAVQLHGRGVQASASSRTDTEPLLVQSFDAALRASCFAGTWTSRSQ